MLELLNFHKIEVHPVTPSNPDEKYKGDCPFCDSDRFHVNIQKQMWDCKKCGKEGNQYTMLTQIYEQCEANSDDYEKLATQRRGILPATLEDAGFVWDNLNSRWLVPYQNGSEFLNNLGAFRPEYGFKIFKSPGMPLKLYRPFDKKDFKDTVVIVEGEWDLLAIKPFLPREYSVTAVPGAMTFKEEFIPNFRGKHVILCYDKDDSGKAGIAKAVRLLNPVAESIKFLQWPDDFHFRSADDPNEDGKDLRDLVTHLS